MEGEVSAGDVDGGEDVLDVEGEVGAGDVDGEEDVESAGEDS